MSALWHYTCDHGHAQITNTLVPGAVLVGRRLKGPGDLIWLTDLPHPNRDALGLTSHILSCDRITHRYRLTDGADVVQWMNVRRAYPWAAELESAPGARPRHWFVSGVPVPVVYDPIPARVA